MPVVAVRRRSLSNIVRLHTPAGAVRLIKRREPATAAVRIGDDVSETLAPEDDSPERESLAVDPLPVVHAEETFEQRLQAEFKAGFDEGRRHTERTLRAELASQLSAERGRIDAFAQAIESALGSFLHALERDAVKLAIAIAERIVKREIADDREIVLGQIHEAMRRLVGVEKVKIRIHPKDEELVRSMRSALIAGSDAVRELAIEQDESVAPGGCVLESDSGNVDASIATQFERIETALFCDRDENT